MTRFRYLADPLCVTCCGAYVINRFALKPFVASTFLHGYFNDTLLIPCALPPVLWLQRKLGLRKDDAAPQLAEVLFHWAVWSLLFEWAGPHLVPHATGDPLDVVAYGFGALLAFSWWKLHARSPYANWPKL